MDATPLRRLRWRLRGAWLWPSFFVLTVADAAIIHRLPLSGDSPENLVGGWLLGCVLSLIAIVLLGGVVGRLVRRLAPDMPTVVARNYGGTLVTLAVTLMLLGAGLLHHPAIAADRNALQDATARAVAYIGDHAPARFQANMRVLDMLIVQPRVIYRFCVTDRAHTQDYCVIVNREQPFGRSVHYTGSESNNSLGRGTN
jgi:hypothetical protein